MNATVPFTLALVGAAAATAQAQRRFDRPSERVSALALLVGPATSNYEGTGNGFAGAFSVSVPSGRVFLVEPGISWFSHRTSVGDRITFLLPEVSVQVETPRGAVRPYLGVGAGFSEYLSGRGSTFGTLHAAAGLRARLGGSVGFRAEVRLRSIDPFHQSTTGFLIGLTKRLSPG